MEPSFNTWTIIFLIAAMQGVFLSIMLFIRKSGANKILGWLTLSFSVCLLFYVLYWTGYSQLLPWRIAAIQGLTFLFGPLTYFYIRSDKRKRYINYWHFIPFILYTAYFVFDVPPRSIAGPFLAVFQITHLIIYSVLIFYWLSNNKGYNNGALKRYKWQKKIAWSMMGYSFSFLLYYILVWAGLLKVEYDYMISIASSFFIYFIGYHGFQNQEVLRMNEASNYVTTSLSSSARHSIMKELRTLMEGEKIYLQSSLRLNDIADRLQLLPHHISQVINEIEEKHFSDYINEYRIQEAKKLLVESNFKIIHVAYDTGFNNKASFNSAFKKITGQTPSKYREAHLSKE